MLKAQLHAHTNYLQDTEGNYSPKELIDRAFLLGYDVLCITEHYIPKAKLKTYKQDPLKTYREFKEYAEKKGILLLPGVEFFAEEGEVLLINFKENIKKFKSIKDLKKLPEETLIVASHPFYGASSCMGEKLTKYHKYIHGVEYSHYYTSFFNPNKKAVAFAKKYKKVVVSTGDVHRLHQLETSFTLVDAKKSPEDFIKAIKKGKVKIITQPLSIPKLLRITLWVVFATLKVKIKEILSS